MSQNLSCLKKSLVFIGLVLLLLCACFDSPVQQTTNVGIIKGRVVTSDGYGVPDQLLIIYGTNFMAFTDSTGNYSFYNVPAGTYRISAAYNGDSVANAVAEVFAGETALPADIIITAFTSDFTGSVTYAIDGIFFCDASLRAPMFSENYLGFTNILPYTPDSIYLEFSIYSYPGGTVTSAKGPPLERAIQIKQNHTLVYSAVPLKGRVHTHNLSFSGSDTFSITADSVLVRRFVIMDSAHFVPAAITENRLFITIAPAAIYKSSSGMFFTVQNDTFRVQYEREDSLDWDLFLVNDSTGDTCSWRNQNPDWGEQLTSADNPKFSGDGFTYAYNDPDSSMKVFYIPDQIYAVTMASGTYSVYVRYFDGPASCDSATPVLSIELGLTSGSKIVNFLQSSPVQPLKKGDVWYAGKISIPAFEYAPHGQAKMRFTR
jgi:hypothetical protein